MIIISVENSCAASYFLENCDTFFFWILFMKVEKSFFTATFDQFNAFFNFSKITLNSSVYKYIS